MSHIETVWRQADKYKVPRLCFANKMDKMGADFVMSLNSIHERLNPRAVAVQLPIGAEENMRGLLISLRRKLLSLRQYGEQIVEIPYQIR